MIALSLIMVFVRTRITIGGIYYFLFFIVVIVCMGRYRLTLIIKIYGSLGRDMHYY